MEEIRAVENDMSSLKLMYGFNHRHHESIIKAKELLDSGRYGNILWMRGRYGKSVDSTFFQNWRSKREFAGGGILLDQGIHMLDLFLYFADDFDDYKAFVSNLYWRLDIEDNVFAIMRNSKTNVTASLHSTMTQWRHLFSLEIFCEEGYMTLNGLKTSSKTYGDEVLSVAKNRTTAPAATWEDEEKFYYDIDNSWRFEVEHFLHCINSDLPVSKGHSGDALKIMRAIERIYQNSCFETHTASQNHFLDRCRAKENIEFTQIPHDPDLKPARISS
jgi:predicted dehydrogenase